MIKTAKNRRRTAKGQQEYKAKLADIILKKPLEILDLPLIDQENSEIGQKRPKTVGFYC